jgi:hypothetical protein
VPASDECITRIRALIEQQLQLLNVTLSICDKGAADFANEQLKCGLSEKVRAVAVQMSLAGGQSITRALEFEAKRGIPVRDCFPIARSAVETLINATYVLAVGETVAEKAIRHAEQKFYRDANRSVGQGDYRLQITASAWRELGEDHAQLKEALQEFTSARGREKNWTDDSVPLRIEAVGQRLGVIPASGLLGAYALVYGDASEIIHGSLYGIQFFYHGRDKSPETVEDFHALTVQHLEGIFFALFLALNSYLRAFCITQKFAVLGLRLERHFDEFVETVSLTSKHGVSHERTQRAP